MAVFSITLKSLLFDCNLVHFSKNEGRPTVKHTVKLLCKDDNCNVVNYIFMKTLSC